MTNSPQHQIIKTEFSNTFNQLEKVYIQLENAGNNPNYKKDDFNYTTINQALAKIQESIKEI